VLRSAHERHRGHERPLTATPDDLLRAEAVEDRHDRRTAEPPGECVCRRLQPARLGRNDAEVEVGELVRAGGGHDARGELVPAADAQALLVESVRVIFTPGQNEHLGDGGEVAREEAADRAGADHAHPHANLAFRYRR
jgi:hypothetical protein